MIATARDIALVFLAIEALLIGTIPFLLIAAMAYGVHRLRRWMLDALRRLAKVLSSLQVKVEGVASKIVAPLIAVRSRWHQLTVMRSHITRKLTLNRR